MDIIFSKADQANSVEFKKQLITLLKPLPFGAAFVSAMEEDTGPFNISLYQQAIDASQVSFTYLDDGSLRIWINPEATKAALDLVIDQYALLLEIAIAVYPVLRLMKRLFTEFGEKLGKFAERFERKVSPLLGLSVPVKFGGWEGVPVSWREAKVVAARGEQVIVQIKSNCYFAKANKDGELYYSTGEAVETFEQAAEGTGIGNDPNNGGWDLNRPGLFSNNL